MYFNNSCFQLFRLSQLQRGNNRLKTFQSRFQVLYNFQSKFIRVGKVIQVGKRLKRQHNRSYRNMISPTSRPVLALNLNWPTALKNGRNARRSAL